MAVLGLMLSTLVVYVAMGWGVVRVLSRRGWWECADDCWWKSSLYNECGCGARSTLPPTMMLWLWPVILSATGTRRLWSNFVGSAIVESKQAELRRREKAVEDMEKELGL